MWYLSEVHRKEVDDYGETYEDWFRVATAFKYVPEDDGIAITQQVVYKDLKSLSEDLLKSKRTVAGISFSDDSFFSNKGDFQMFFTHDTKDEPLFGVALSDYCGVQDLIGMTKGVFFTDWNFKKFLAWCLKFESIMVSGSIKSTDFTFTDTQVIFKGTVIFDTTEEI